MARIILRALVLLFCTVAITGCSDDKPSATVSATPPIQVSATATPTLTPAAATVSAATPSPTAVATLAAATPVPTPFVPVFAVGPCPFKPGAGQREGMTLDCGTVSVPEQHARPDGPKITLAVARFKASGARPQAEPLIWLDGGPGGPSLSSFAEQLSLVVARLFDADRDLILFDQRGVGYSRPSLVCKEAIDLKYRTLNLRRAPRQAADDAIAASLTCRDRLRREGVNLAAYTSAENAADVNDIRIALGYDKVNLYGVSYGTRLALTVMRDFPGMLRAVILDSTVPVQANLYPDVAFSADRAFGELFSSCAADPRCAAAYPNLEAVFTSVAARLNDKPVSITITHPKTQQPYDFMLTGDQFVSGLFQALYRTDLIPALPKVIFAARDGDYQPFAAAVRDILFYDELSQGMYYSVQCGEEVRFTTRSELAAGTARARPAIAHAFANGEDDEALFTVCDQWGATPAPPRENQPVNSDLPVLVLSGQFDPITPPAYGQSAARTLTHSSFFQFPGIGHGVMVSAICPLNMAQAFLNSPETPPDARCIGRMTPPEWSVSR